MLNNDIWKYCYWISSETLSDLQQQMLNRETSLIQAEKNPCEVLAGEIGVAEPDVWSVICRHDAAPWYNQSKFKGKILVVSSFSLGNEYEEYLETTITPVDFEPLRSLTEDEKEALVNSPGFQNRKPPEWDSFPRETGEQITQGLAKITGKTAGSWEDLFQTWTAVHANFVSPQYRANEKFLNSPYSIADSYTISSCCVELFNLLESEEKALLVRPCTGAVMIKLLKKDHYYFVKLVKNN